MLPRLAHAALARQDSAHPYLGRVFSHRACAPVDAPYVELACRTRPSVLPRWHQDDRGPSNVTRGHHQYAPDGAYARVPVWVSREHWLSTVVPVALAFHVEKLARRVSPELMRRYLTVRSGYAIAGTGRRCIVRPDTIASVLQIATRTVQLCQRVAREIGLEVVITTGRMLNVTECTAARRRGSRQRGLSTEVAFTCPAAIPRHLWIFTPTRGTPLPAHLDCEKHSLKATTAARGQKEDAASPRQHRPRRVDPGRVRRLALEMAHTLPWLASEGPRRLAPALTRFVACTPSWTAEDLVLALSDAALRQGRRSPLADRSIRTRPAVLFAAMLRELDEQADHPGAAFTTPAPPAGRCYRPGCDGWVEIRDAQGALDGARPCPDPQHRRQHHPATDSAGADGWDMDQAPF